ncbi:MAG: ATP-binding protein [Sedimentisphaerales bacterium]|nr:ATP-binding protein [Sedimentisphaerales bacterium]
METKQIQNEQTIAAKNAAPGTYNRQEQQTKEQLLSEMKSLRAHMAGLERLEGEHERIEQALIKALQEWEATFNATRDPIMLVDKEFRIVQANQSASRFFGKPLGKILGQTTHSLLYGTELPPDDCPLVIVKQTNKHEEAELYLPSKDAWVAVSADPAINVEDTTACFVHIIRDITYRKKTEQVLAKLNQDLHKTVQELKKSNQELRSFAHVIAHDLKSPLRGIGSIADRLIRKYTDTLDDEGKDQLRLLIVRVRRMSEFIDGILRYSEIGHVVTEQQDVDVNVLLAEIIGEIVIPDNFEITIEQTLPTIRCERLRLKQVFQNLLSNAVKYMDKPKAQIRIGCTEENGSWKFSVADNGCGIKEQYFEKIFEIFQTLSSRDKTESTGIGLTIVKKIVELYGGKVWVASKVGEGSTFFFTLPKTREMKNANTKTNTAC